MVSFPTVPLYRNYSDLRARRAFEIMAIHTAMSNQQLRSYLKAWRLKWALSQEELAELVGISGSVISDHERDVHPLSARLLIAAELIFGITAIELFPGLYGEVENNVCIAAGALYQRLEGKMDARSLKKLKLISGIPARTRSLDL
jgi:transcriptional regulator with XRE-family HTH domain